MKKKKILLVFPLVLTLTNLKSMNSDQRLAVASSSSGKKSYLQAAGYSHSQQTPRHLDLAVLSSIKTDDPDFSKAIKSLQAKNAGTNSLVAVYQRGTTLLHNNNVKDNHEATKQIQSSLIKIKDKITKKAGDQETSHLLAGIELPEQIDLSQTLFLSRQVSTAEELLQSTETQKQQLHEQQQILEEEKRMQEQKRALLLQQLKEVENQNAEIQESQALTRQHLQRVEQQQKVVQINHVMASKVHDEYQKQKNIAALKSYVERTTQDCVKFEKEITKLKEQQASLELLKIAGQALDDAEWQERDQQLTALENQIEEFSTKKQRYEERIERAERGENPISATSSSAFQPFITAALQQIRRPHEEPKDAEAPTAQASYDLDTIALSGLSLDDKDVQSALVTLEKTKEDQAPLHLGMALLYAHALLMNAEVQKDSTLKSTVTEYLNYYKTALNNPTILKGLEALTRTDNNPLDLTASKMFKNDRAVMDNFMGQLSKLKASQTQTQTPLSEMQNTEAVVVEQVALLARAQITNDYLLRTAKLESQIKTNQKTLDDINGQLSTLQAQQAAETTNDAKRATNIKKLESQRKAAEEALAKVTAEKTHLQEEYLKALESQTPQDPSQNKQLSWFWRLLGYK